MGDEVIRFEPEVFYYTYAAHAPGLRLQPGETIETWTDDSSNGDPQGAPIPPERTQSGEGLLEGNPATGPFYIEGAEPGDTLQVHFDAIELNRAAAFGAVQSHLAVSDCWLFGRTGVARRSGREPHHTRLSERVGGDAPRRAADGRDLRPVGAGAGAGAETALANTT